MKNHITINTVAWNDIVGSKVNSNIRSSVQSYNQALDEYQKIVNNVKNTLETKYEYKSTIGDGEALKLKKSIFVYNNSVSVIDNG